MRINHTRRYRMQLHYQSLSIYHHPSYHERLYVYTSVVLYQSYLYWFVMLVLVYNLDV
jgi:hypothetical protein